MRTLLDSDFQLIARLSELAFAFAQGSCPLVHQQTQLSLALGQMPDAQMIGNPAEPDCRKQHQECEQLGLIEVRAEDEGIGRLRLSPFAVGAYLDQEKIFPGRNVRVVSRPPLPGLAPVLVEPLQHVAELELLRIDKAGRGELKLK